MSSTTIEPGKAAQVVLSLPMGMHTGMDGPHLFRIEVPVRSASGESGVLEMYFKGLFQ